MPVAKAVDCRTVDRRVLEQIARERVGATRVMIGKRKVQTQRLRILLNKSLISSRQGFNPLERSRVQFSSQTLHQRTMKDLDAKDIRHIAIDQPAMVMDLRK